MLRKRGPIAAAVSISIVIVAAVGCGGSNDGDTTATATVTKAVYAKQANSICNKADRKKNEELEAALAKLGKETSEPTQASQEKLVSEVAIPPIAQMATELGELPLPEGEEQRAEAMVAAFKKEVAALEANPGSVIEGTGGGFTAANKYAAAFGMTACAAI